jgi:hypothetical protein
MNTQTTTPTKSFRVGDIVQFGRTHGEKTRGRILRISAKSLSIETIEERGNGRGSAVGKKWRVHPSLVQAVSPNSASPSPSNFGLSPYATLRANVDSAQDNFLTKALDFGLGAPVTVEAFNNLKAALAAIAA